MDDAKAELSRAAISVSDAGRYLGVSSDTVRRLIRSGALPHARIGNSIRIRCADLDAYLQDQTTTQWRPVDGRGRKTGASVRRRTDHSAK